MVTLMIWSCIIEERMRYASLNFEKMEMNEK